MNKNKLRGVATLVVLLATWFVRNLPLQNSAGVNQLNDTPTSSLGLNIMTEIVTHSFLIALVLIVLIWSASIKQLFIKK